MSFEHAPVRHARFGAGEVRSIRDSRICIRFDATAEEKTFAFPEAFEQFLSTDHSPLLEQVGVLLSQKKQAEAQHAQEYTQRISQLHQERKKQTRSRSASPRTVKAK